MLDGTMKDDMKKDSMDDDEMLDASDCWKV